MVVDKFQKCEILYKELLSFNAKRFLLIMY